MCGIAGQLLLDPAARADRAAVEAMLRPIAHRGPDGHGVYLDGPVGLGHRRLSIIDVEGGIQPMTNEDESVWIVFNGEIYNFQALHDGLVARGHVFRSRCDTEVIIHLYEEHGADCVKFLQGMFTFAIWDKKRRRLVVARDRVGIKPLYYCQTATTLYFGSELKSIIADPAVSRELSAPALRRVLSFYYPAGNDTLFKSIRKLPPGHHLTVENGRVEIKQYWDLVFTQERWNRSFDDVVTELDGLLANTVRDHMIADVPVGVLLSGGVDSTAVLSYAVKGATKKIKTFTVGFSGDQVVDERPYARLAAERFGTEHYDLTISADDFWNFLPAYVRHMEEPVCEAPAVALFYVSQLAQKHVKVVLSGEGGDEAFAGYPNYPNMLRLQRVQGMLGPLARPAGAVAGWAGAMLGNQRVQRYAGALGRPLPEHYFSRRSYPALYFNRQAGKVLTPAFERASHYPTPAQVMADFMRPARGWPVLDQMLYADTKTWLPDDLLIKADKITMANSLELRVPLLDHKVLEFAASLPADFKVRDRDTKRALKAVFTKAIPQEILNRKKVGFPVPYDHWLRHDLAERTRDLLLSDRAINRGYFQRAEIERLLARQRQHGGLALEVFSLLAIEFWHREFIDSSP